MKIRRCLQKEILKHIDTTFYGKDDNKIKGILSLCIHGVNAMKLLENTKTVLQV